MTQTIIALPALAKASICPTVTQAKKKLLNREEGEKNGVRSMARGVASARKFFFLLPASPGRIPGVSERRKPNGKGRGEREESEEGRNEREREEIGAQKRNFCREASAKTKEKVWWAKTEHKRRACAS